MIFCSAAALPLRADPLRAYISERTPEDSDSVPELSAEDSDTFFDDEEEPAAIEPFGEGTAAGEKKTISVKGVDYTFCWCPPGEFQMGSPETEERHDFCEQQHTVRLSCGFWMLDSEVTQQMWKSITDDPDYDERTDEKWGKGDSYPMYIVNWIDCQDFCRQFSDLIGQKVAIPTEAQWEYACRAGSEGPYAGTGQLDEMGWYQGNSGGQAHEVKTKEPNAWGLYDMHGSVWEWCADWFDGHYYESSPEEDPAGPEDGIQLVVRGGDWKHSGYLCRSAYRFAYDPQRYYPYLGFRIIVMP